MATAFAGLSNSFAYGSVVLGTVAVITAIGWGAIIMHRAEKEARAEAEKCATRMIETWLAQEAPTIIRQKVEMLQDASIGRTDDDDAADEMGRAAG